MDKVISDELNEETNINEETVNESALTNDPEKEEVKKEEVRKGVMAAYHDILNKLKFLKTGSENTDQENELQAAEDEMVVLKNNVIKAASGETANELAKNLAELKLFISKSLDDIKIKLTNEYDKFHTLRQAILYSQDELANLYDIKTNVNTLSQIIMAQNEKKESFEKEMAARRYSFESEKMQTEKERFREQAEYMQKRDAARALDQEQYENEKIALYEELAKKRQELEEEFEAREAALAAREHEHQQLKEREGRILAREQEYSQLKENEIKHQDELRAAVAKAESHASEQLIKRYEYDLKLKQIEWESERKLDQQKISALEQQIDKYKSLKQLFND